MSDIIQQNWLAFAAVALVALLILVWLIGRASKPPRAERRPDVLDEGAAPAARNQALIDSPMAMTIVPPAAIATTVVDPLGGLGEAEAAPFASENAEAVQWEAAERVAEADAEPDAIADDLNKLKGVGPKLVALLHGLGVTRFAQIAEWREADIDRIDAQLGPFQGRIRRDNWVDQARLLANGDTSAYEATFGKL